MGETQWCRAVFKKSAFLLGKRLIAVAFADKSKTIRERKSPNYYFLQDFHFHSRKYRIKCSNCPEMRVIPCFWLMTRRIQAEYDGIRRP
jgi:hypothetical protein